MLIFGYKDIATFRNEKKPRASCMLLASFLAAVGINIILDLSVYYAANSSSYRSNPKKGKVTANGGREDSEKKPDVDN
ncbi:hypothetical protein BK138_32345 [Paenibacillus rhizosphaerae]|uniref:Uncharacterized protein n=1 Tax=Paenibacillus rhizosphaerae TaxID=297318 RepID=A0A1R1E674_9BACL|nr:hypothetical protein [Paenibacillus rhizosphaerae]OMF47324.1 hypothetical protein BK138_32345 [Paenibacillus rhizosphaerae]